MTNPLNDDNFFNAYVNYLRALTPQQRRDEAEDVEGRVKSLDDIRKRAAIYDIDREVFGAVVNGSVRWSDLPQATGDQCTVCFTDVSTVQASIVPLASCANPFDFTHETNYARLCSKHLAALSSLPLETEVLLTVALSGAARDRIHKVLAEAVPPEYRVRTVEEARSRPDEELTRVVAARDGGRCTVLIHPDCRTLGGALDMSKIGDVPPDRLDELGVAPYDRKAGYRWTKNAYRRPVAGHIYSASRSEAALLAPKVSASTFNVVAMCDPCNELVGAWEPTPREGLRYWFIAAGLL